MNKLIKRFSPLLCTHFFFSLHTWNHPRQIKKYERKRKGGREKERGRARVRQRMSAYAEVQQQQERGEEWSRLERREEAREKEWEREKEKESHMSSWNDVPHSPRLRIPKYLVLEMWKPGARRTPFPREAPLVSLVRETAGSSGVQTSAKRQAREMCTHCASFFPPLFPPFFSLSLSLYSFFVLCFRCDTTLLPN